MVRSGRSLRAEGGFTLIELLVVLTVVGILTAIAVPSYTQIIANSRVKSATGSLQVALTKARAEALKRNCSITVTPKTPGNWNNGWTVVATELNCDPGNTLPPDDDSDITLQDDEVKRVTVTPVPAALTQVTYLSSGRVLGATELKFHLQDPQGVAMRRCVLVDPSGLPKVKQDAACPAVPT